MRLFSIFSSIEAKERERKNIYIYWRLNALVRRSVYSWCAQGWDSSPGRDRRVQRRHEREKTMKKRRKWNSISSRANTFGAVCYVTSLLGERGGLLKRLRCHLVCRSSPLETGATKGRCLILEKSASFHAARLSPPPPPPIIIPRITNAELKLNVTPGPRPSSSIPTPLNMPTKFLRRAKWQ